MIKKILVALDQDSDTAIAIKYAVQIAHLTKAKITGLAIVDTKEIKESMRGGGIGSFYYAEKLEANLTSETRDQARKLISAFEKSVDLEGLEHVEIVEEGVPFERIVEDMKYHDLLVVGSDPHFFYGHPEQHTNTLAGIFYNSIGASLIVPKAYKKVKRVLFASDGSNHSARTLQQFVHLAPFGNDLEIVVLQIHEKESKDVELQLELTKSYLEFHGYSASVMSMIDNHPEVVILEQAKALNIDLIVSGGTAHSGFTGTKFGKHTAHLINNSTIPLFMDK